MRGLALRSATPQPARARINLVPPDLLERRRARQKTAALVVAAVAFVAMLGGVYVFEGMKLGKAESALETQQATNAGLKTQVARLTEFERLEIRAKQKVELLDGLTRTEVRWSAVLADLSLAIPSNVWLTSFSGAMEQSLATATPGAPIASIQMNGTTFEHIDVARWLTRLADVKQFTFPYISLSQKSELFGRKVVQFNSSVKLSQDALRANQKGGKRVP